MVYIPLVPSKNVIKPYVANSYYHIYNRGVNKQLIFNDQQDYAVFLTYLRIYLSPKDTDSLLNIVSNSGTDPNAKAKAIREFKLNNFYEKISLISFCLMPNHYHLLIHQSDEKDIVSFMKSIMTRYSAYYNKRNKRIGPLFQDKYKAVLVLTDEQLLHLSRYIHRNPLNLVNLKRTVLDRTVFFRQPSSYPVYLGMKKQEWIISEDVLSAFSKTGFNSYQQFV